MTAQLLLSFLLADFFLLAFPGACLSPGFLLAVFFLALSEACDDWAAP